MNYVESTARTNRLWCSDCNSKIKSGDNVIFLLDYENRMEEVYCKKCSLSYLDKTFDNCHPFSDEAF